VDFFPVRVCDIEHIGHALTLRVHLGQGNGEIQLVERAGDFVQEAHAISGEDIDHRVSRRRIVIDTDVCGNVRPRAHGPWGRRALPSDQVLGRHPIGESVSDVFSEGFGEPGGHRCVVPHLDPEHVEHFVSALSPARVELCRENR